MKKLLGIIPLTIMILSLLGCSKTGVNQESEASKSSIEETSSGYQPSFPELYTDTVDNVEFNMKIVVDADLKQYGLITGKARLQKVNADAAFERLFNGISDYETYIDEGENEFGETVEGGYYRSPDQTAFSKGGISSQINFHKKGFVGFVRNAFIPDPEDIRYNADLFSKEKDLDFMPRSEAFKVVEDLLKEINIEAEYEYTGYALDYETMQAEEHYEDMNGNIDKSAYKEQWTKEDDSYYFFINQIYRKLPVYHKYYELFTEVTDINMPIQAIVAEDGIRDISVQRVFDFSEEKAVGEVATIEEVAATVANKFNQILGTGIFEITEARLYYYVDLASGKGEYKVKPVWIVKGAEKAGGTPVQMVVDAQNAKEIIP